MVLIAIGVAINALVDWLILSVHYKNEFEQFWNKFFSITVKIPLIIILTLTLIYYIIPPLRPVVDVISKIPLVAIDRFMYSSSHDNPEHEEFTTGFYTLPIYPENYDLTIPNEVCADKVNFLNRITYELVSESCGKIPWTPSIFDTYLKTDPDGYAFLSVEEGRKLHQMRTYK